VLSSVASKPSFIIMVAQGVTFGIPGNALAFLTLFFQVSGYADVQAGLIMLGGGIGSVGAGLLGGMLGDYYNVHFPLTGRVAVAQTSVVLGIGFFFVVAVHSLRRVQLPSCFNGVLHVQFDSELGMGLCIAPDLRHDLS